MDRLLLCATSLGAMVLMMPLPAAPQPLAWPTYGPDRGYLRVDGWHGSGDGLANSLPDFVGPVDGTASLTIFTEGNHFPVLLPLALERFPEWCRAGSRCVADPARMLFVTLPQAMIVRGLRQGGFQLGNAQLPVAPDAAVFPDLVMLGTGAMREVAAMEMLHGPARVFARHRGLGLLVRRDQSGAVRDLATLERSGLPFVIAGSGESGARTQYMRTLNALLGTARTEALMQRELGQFPGRLGIQHRDVPYAVVNGMAAAGIVFSHLARFYAATWPDRLVFIEEPAALPFGEVIAVARTRRAPGDASLAAAFVDFLLEAAPEAYLAGGFTAASAFGFGGALDLAR